MSHIDILTTVVSPNYSGRWSFHLELQLKNENLEEELENEQLAKLRAEKTRTELATELRGLAEQLVTATNNTKG